ncbi:MULTISPECIES: SH3 domain-containing protein [Winogradskyella]|uniref:SH3 domain-containing protein n=1 Tax=Winogradskyella TaxID=286104 RepID=UPI0015C71F98|nr:MULTISPECIES: SH3 domain-containing protein [Winogradskyella]QXP79012.1 SH3 domain-containing protein [Winogradskyella sp. HaHa_3_26]
MKNISYIIITLVFWSCQGQNKDVQKTVIKDFISNSEKESNNIKVLFLAYTTAEKGLNYRKEPDMNSEVLGKLNYGTKVDVVDDSNRSLFWVDDLERGSLYGKWVGIYKDSSIVYVFNAYLYKSSPKIEKNIKLVNNKLEVIYIKSENIDSNQKMTIEKHIQISNHLEDYVIIKLLQKEKTIFEYKINYLLKEYYTLTKTNDKIPTYNYLTIFDECPSSEYKQTFAIKENKILKISEKYTEADEEVQDHN